MTLFYLGTHRPSWLATLDVPLFVSRRVLANRKTLPRARNTWVLDSGGFTELSLHGRWSISIDQYAREVERYRDGIGRLAWVAPMDWMCEPSIIAKTGLSVATHQARTLVNFERLRARLGSIVAPVLQGWRTSEYHAHASMYEKRGWSLAEEPIVGVGSICRRGDWQPISRIVRSLADTGLRLHGFGIRGDALHALSDALTSADSMAWSYTARYSPPLTGCTHASCANCARYAVAWQSRMVEATEQTRIEVTT